MQLHYIQQVSTASTAAGAAEAAAEKAAKAMYMNLDLPEASAVDELKLQIIK